MTAALMYTALLLWLSVSPIFMQCCKACTDSKQLLLRWAIKQKHKYVLTPKMHLRYADIIERLEKQIDNTTCWGIHESLDKQFHIAQLEGFKAEQANICVSLAKDFDETLDLQNFRRFFHRGWNYRRGVPRWYAFKSPSDVAKTTTVNKGSGEKRKHDDVEDDDGSSSSSSDGCTHNRWKALCIRSTSEEQEEIPDSSLPNLQLTISSALPPDLPKEELRPADSPLRNEESSDDWIGDMESGIPSDEGWWNGPGDSDCETKWRPAVRS